jgi:hypothetical protein
MMYDHQVPVRMIDGFTVTNCQHAISTHQTELAIHNCIITGNASIDGYVAGGISCPESYAEVVGCIITNNTNVSSGGGILLWASAMDIRDSVIAGNQASSGGGIVVSESSLTMRNCIITGNKARYQGGGIQSCNNLLTMEDCIVSGNQAQDKGGALFNQLESDWSAVLCTNCTITGNQASEGGGIYFYIDPYSYFSFEPSFKNCVIWGNSGLSQFYGFIFVDHTVIEGGWFPELSIPESYDFDPCFADPGYWADPCGTPADANDDVWVDGDYHLKSQAGRWDPNTETWVQDAVTSLCIDAGDPNDPNWNSELWPHGGRINMGAYGGTPQASMSLSNTGNIADLNHDSSVDYLDIDLFGDKWPVQEVLLSQDMDRNGKVNGKDFATLARNWRWKQ